MKSARAASWIVGLLAACGCHPHFHVHVVYQAADKTWSVGLGEPEGEAGDQASPPSNDVGADLEGLLESLGPERKR